MSRAAVYLILLGMFVQLGLVGVVFYSTYTSRADLVAVERADCERTKNDRVVLIAITQAVTASFANSDDANPGPESAERLASEEIIKREVDALIKRAEINCFSAFPNAKLLP